MKHSALLVCAGALLLGGAAGGYGGVLALASAGAVRVAGSAAVGSRDAAASRDVARPSPATARTAAQSEPHRSGSPSIEAAEVELAAEPLALSELLAPGNVLAPSAKAQALAGQRVRLVGFMAQLELPIPGAFYLVPRPIVCDEAGAGTADLMPSSVLVLSESAAGQEVAFVPGALEVRGLLEVGNKAGADGRVSAFRLHLERDRPPPPIEPATHASSADPASG